MKFREVVAAALEVADDKNARDILASLERQMSELELHTFMQAPAITARDADWVQLIARHERAMYMHAEGPIEVTVLDYRYTPNGILYTLVLLCQIDEFVRQFASDHF
jgi:hypothetical protein